MQGSVNLLQGFTRILGVLLTRTRSQYAALLIFSGIGAGDFLFRAYLFPVYIDFLQNIGANPDWAMLDVGFAPILWLSFFAIILGSLTIVITFAAQNVPKLIDLYMDHWPSLLFVWWAAACLAHALSIKLLAEGEIQIISSLVFNYHVLLVVSLVIGFPFIFSISLILVSGQCVIDYSYFPSGANYGLDPDTLPNGYVGQMYDEDMTFFLPLDTVDGGVTVTFEDFHITSISLPLGLTWECNNSSNNDNVKYGSRDLFS